MRRHLLVPVTRCSREFRQRTRHLRPVPTPPTFRSTMTRLAMLVGLAASLLALALVYG